MPSTKGLVLLTGGTGHIGFRTLLFALRAGYTVRAAIRRPSSIAEIQAVESIQPYLSQLTFVTVPDITAPGAFDQAVKGVDYVLHIASPLAIPSEDHEATIIQPALRGTVGMLESALKEKSIKRVVITASIVSVMPGAAWGPGFDEVVYPNTSVPDMVSGFAVLFSVSFRSLRFDFPELEIPGQAMSCRLRLRARLFRFSNSLAAPRPYVVLSIPRRNLTNPDSERTVQQRYARVCLLQEPGI